jgi:hypothetical protein
MYDFREQGSVRCMRTSWRNECCRRGRRQFMYRQQVQGKNVQSEGTERDVICNSFHWSAVDLEFIQNEAYSDIEAFILVMIFTLNMNRGSVVVKALG